VWGRWGRHGMVEVERAVYIRIYKEERGKELGKELHATMLLGHPVMD